jgi:alanine racemase
VLAWLHDPDDDFVSALAEDIELGIANLEQLERIQKAAIKSRKPGLLHLKVDTGLGRNGSTLDEWPGLLRAVKASAESGLVRVVGIFSHLSGTSEADDLEQIAKFDAAVELARELGVDFEVRHLTASDGSLAYPQAHYDMVRVGIALYGLDPFSEHRASEYGLTPAMTAKAKVSQIKTVPGGHGVSYGYLHKTADQSTLALVPIGYAEGLPRNATGRAVASIHGKKYAISSRVAMDQFVLDVGNDKIKVGDEVILFGDPAAGAPSVDELADACDTINYEIVTRMGGRFKRVYVGANE